ncbi:MAG: MATE family efflux transporter [Candidatus Aminicenantes bacterium]|nr:MATE family efflux transporter [Candidatus Aminicenantes bacterium]
MRELKYQLKTTIKLAIPVIIGQLGHMMMGVVDSLMVGRLGVIPLAASSLANSIFFLILIVGIGFSYAITPYVAMAYGKKEFSECGVVLRQGLLAGLGIAVVLTVITFGMAGMIPGLKQSTEVVNETIPYMKILGWSIIPVLIFQVYRQFSEGLFFMKPAMIIIIAANILNALFNWIFIFGHWGFPAMGLRGAGYSTFGTRTVMAGMLAAHILSSSKFKPFEPGLHYKKIDWQMMGKLVKLGLASAFQNFFEIGAFAGAAVLIGWFGPKELAAHQIALNMAAITFMFGLGISASASVRVGNAVGRKDFAYARRAGFISVVLSAAVMGSFGILFIILRKQLPQLYVTDVSVINIASSLLIIAALFQISDGVQVVSLGILRGLADTRFPTIITFVAYWVIGLPCGYLLGFVMNYKAQGVWIGLFLGLTVSALLLTTRFHKLTRSKTG